MFASVLAYLVICFTYMFMLLTCIFFSLLILRVNATTINSWVFEPYSWLTSVQFVFWRRVGMLKVAQILPDETANHLLRITKYWMKLSLHLIDFCDLRVQKIWSKHVKFTKIEQRSGLTYGSYFAINLIKGTFQHSVPMVSYTHKIVVSKNVNNMLKIFQWYILRNFEIFYSQQHLPDSGIEEF